MEKRTSKDWPSLLSMHTLAAIVDHPGIERRGIAELVSTNRNNLQYPIEFMESKGLMRREFFPHQHYATRDGERLIYLLRELELLT